MFFCSCDQGNTYIINIYSIAAGLNLNSLLSQWIKTKVMFSVKIVCELCL